MSDTLRIQAEHRYAKYGVKLYKRPNFPLFCRWHRQAPYIRGYYRRVRWVQAWTRPRCR